MKANGTLSITNKRIAFVAKNAAALPNPNRQVDLRTLSCPLTHFLDGHFVQPWLAANYYEAHIRPVRDGGLQGPHGLKIDFKEGRGFEFSNVVEEVKNRFGDGQPQNHEPETLRPFSSPARANPS